MACGPHGMGDKWEFVRTRWMDDDDVDGSPYSSRTGPLPTAAAAAASGTSTLSPSSCSNLIRRSFLALILAFLSSSRLALSSSACMSPMHVKVRVRHGRS